MHNVLTRTNIYTYLIKVNTITGKWGIRKDDLLLEMSDGEWIYSDDILDDVILENIPKKDVYYVDDKKLVRTTGRETKRYIEVEIERKREVRVPVFKSFPFLFYKEGEEEYTIIRWRPKKDFILEINEC